MPSTSTSTSSTSSTSSTGGASGGNAGAGGATTTTSAGPNVASVCPQLKLRYEACFQSWYTHEFLTRQSHTLPCEPEFLDYRRCVVDHLHREGMQKELIYIDESRLGSLSSVPATPSTSTSASAKSPTVAAAAPKRDA